MRRLTSLTGILIGLVGLIFVVRELIRNRVEIVTAMSEANTAVLVGALVVGLVSMASIGIAWRRCLSVLGAVQPLSRSLHSYFVGQLGKYVPGGIWPVVGRAEMARRDGVRGSIAYSSTALSMGITYLAAILTAATAMITGAAERDSAPWWPVLLLLPLGLLVLHPAVAGRAVAAVSRLRRRDLDLSVPSWGTSVSLLVQHVPAWIGISAATWMIASTLSPESPSFANIVLATCLSWVLGFLAVGVPGGIGIREAVFVATAVTLPSTGTAAAVSLVSRILFVLVDLLGAGLATLALGRRHSPASPKARGDVPGDT